MPVVSRHSVQFGARHKTYSHAIVATILYKALQPHVVALLGHSDPFKGSAARLQRFGDGIDAVYEIHERSVYRSGWTAAGTARDRRTTNSGMLLVRMLRTFSTRRLPT